MAIRLQSLDFPKLVEAMLYAAQRLQRPTFHSVSKMLYFADRCHLERYGRLAIGDSYRKMEYGPVPSVAYDVMKYVAGTSNRDYIDPVVPKNHQLILSSLASSGESLKPLREANEDFLSQSEIECLDEVIAKFGAMSFKQLADASHDGAWKSVDLNRPIPLKNIVHDLPNGREIAAYMAA